MNLSKLFDYSVPLVAAATILVVGAIAITLYGAKIITDIKLANDTIEITGSAKKAVTADMGRWTINLETKTGITDQQTGFNRLETATKKVVAYLESHGFTEYETPTGSSFPQYTYPQYGEPTQIGYSVTRSIVVRSNDVEKLSALANNVEPFV